MNCQISNSYLKSDFDYAKLYASYSFRTIGPNKNIIMKYRGFCGMLLPENGNAPVQDQYWVAEGSPLQRYKYYYLRSPGSLPHWLNYHFPGDGNLRGYNFHIIKEELPFTANLLFTSNFEILFKNINAVLSRSFLSSSFGIDLKLFFDYGKMRSNTFNVNNLYDAGFGFQINKVILGKLRTFSLDFPVFLSSPNLNNIEPRRSRLKFRWLITVN